MKSTIAIVTIGLIGGFLSLLAVGVQAEITSARAHGNKVQNWRSSIRYLGSCVKASFQLKEGRKVDEKILHRAEAASLLLATFGALIACVGVVVQAWIGG